MTRTFITPKGTHSLLKFIEEHQDQKLIWEVRPYKKPRSLGLNNYAWGYVITPLAQFMGQSAEETWRDCCGEFFGWVDKKFPVGQKKPRRTTTTNEQGERDVVNWEVMSNFVEYCKSVCAEYGVPINEKKSA